MSRDDITDKLSDLYQALLPSSSAPPQKDNNGAELEAWMCKDDALLAFAVLLDRLIGTGTLE
jgi:hypothetical protein